MLQFSNNFSFLVALSHNLYNILLHFFVYFLYVGLVVILLVSICYAPTLNFTRIKYNVNVLNTLSTSPF
jgi:hypothetical protein